MNLKKTIRGYKFIQSNMKSKNGNIKWELGIWLKHESRIKICEYGFHACRTALESLQYTYGDKWFIVEARGDFLEERGDKFVCSEMRLVKELPIDKIVKLFAIRCAKRCLKNFEKLNPEDKRPAEAIKAAELYLDGKVTLEELNAKLSAAESAKSAAESACAWSAAESAKSAAWSAWSAASAAKSAWSAAKSAWSAAWSAAESAAESAWSAAKSAAWSAEIKWQTKELDKIIKGVLKDE